MKYQISLLILVLTFLLISAEAGRIQPNLRRRLETGETLDVLIEFPNNDDVFKSPLVLGKASKEERITAMISLLKQRAEVNSSPFIRVLKQRGLDNQRSIKKPLWISNTFEVRDCDLALANVLLQVPGNYVIREQLQTKIILENYNPVDPSIHETKQNPTPQWGVEMIRAPQVWNRTRGEGIVIGIMDTGVMLEHEAFRDGYACKDANPNSTCNGWYDPYFNDTQPTDYNGHGTLAGGVAVGRTNGIGVAPASQWIACRGWTSVAPLNETEALQCAQWFVEEANPRPHVITNSWGAFDPSTPAFFNQALQAWITAGIIPVFAIANFGPGCRTTVSPGNQPFAIGVGATTINDTIASFSSRGPNGYILKPDISAPGEMVTSADPRNASYVTTSGTTLATPHVAGTVALLLSVNPDLDFYQVRAILQSTADRPPVAASDRSCFPSGQEWPNNAFGHGRINAERAMATLLQKLDR